ncbi:MAG: TrkH family potassium uptake protein [Anaerolineae bacterium]|nr:TrkH family potassium uptake protein [Anaerolineae bacterium]
MTATPALRHAAFLRQRYQVIVGFMGLVVLVSGVVILSPLLLLIPYPAEVDAAWGFVAPGGLLAATGLVLWRGLAARRAVSLTWQEGGVALVAAWLLTIGVGSIPLCVVGGLTPAQALFESTSGWTAASPTVLDVSRAGHLLLFYRSVTQLAGGTGFAIIALSALAGPVGPGLTVAEGREDQLLPNVRRSARLVMTMYSAYAIVGVLALRGAGMNWFDAVNHAFTTLSTGGMGTHPESIGYWQNPAIEVVTIVLMLLGMVNFLTAYTLLRGHFQPFARNSQLRLMAILLVVGTVILLAGLAPTFDSPPAARLRVAIFHAVSALSTTGVSTIDMRHWNDLGRLTLLLLMVIGGGAGSTAGGIKLYRIYVLYKGILWQVRRALLPVRAISDPAVWEGAERRFVATDQVRDAALFACLYLAALFLGSGVLVAHNYPLEDSLFEMASALSGVGLTTGITAPAMPPLVLWTETASMFLGRLEFFVVIVAAVRLVQDVPAMVGKRG